MTYRTHRLNARAGCALGGLLLATLAPDVARGETARAALAVSATVIGCRIHSGAAPADESGPRAPSPPAGSVSCPPGIPYEVRVEREGLRTSAPPGVGTASDERLGVTFVTIIY